jgi:ABC-type polysaccharide/polyol phosphate export permease
MLPLGLRGPPPGLVLPFRAVTATSQSTFIHNSAARKRLPTLVANGFREAWSRRQLIRWLVQADVKKKGSDTVLGNIWWILDPLLQMLVYVVLVTFIFERKQPDFPLFVFSAILPWKWFTTSLGDSISSIVAQGPLVKQLQFPKVVLPLSATFAGIVNFAFGMVPLMGLLVFFYRDRLSALILFIPIIAIVQLVFTLAWSLALAAMNVFLRDIGNVSRHLLRLWWYLSPGIYSLETLHKSKTLESHATILRILDANPFAILFTAYRSVIYGTGDGGMPVMPDWTALGVLFAVSLVMVLGGMAIFKRLEPSFAKVL